MSTRGGVSAFGVVHKSEHAPGEYKPVAQMSRTERGQTRRQITAGKRSRAVLKPVAAHSLADTYRDFGYASRDGGIAHPERVHQEMKAEFDKSTHTPSAVHPNIHYGPSMSPQLRNGVDKVLDPSLVKKLKHPVVFHHVPNLSDHGLAAAVPAHTVTGGRGHVALGRHFTLGAKMPIGTAGHAAVVNHELAHAAVRQRPELGVSRARSLGEEARADAVSRTQVYVRNGVVPSAKTLKFQTKLAPKSALKTGTTLFNATRYHHIQGLIGAAQKLRKI